MEITFNVMNLFLVLDFRGTLQFGSSDTQAQIGLSFSSCLSDLFVGIIVLCRPRYIGNHFAGERTEK
jgi:hypothetical protein